MADQLRRDYADGLETPWKDTQGIDELGRRGTRFEFCITPGPICAPARIGLATGIEPFRLGALDNDAMLPRGVPTHYQLLRDHGYHVGCVGKLDLAKARQYNGLRGERPAVFAWGFTHPLECEGKRHAGRFPRPVGPYGAWLESRGLYEQFHADYMKRARTGWVRDAHHDSVLPTDAFEDAFIGRRAVEWIKSRSDEYPWFLLVGFVGPHDPFDPPREYADRYRARPMPPAVPAGGGKPLWVRRRRLNLPGDEVVETRRQYAATVELIDDQIGGLLSALDARGYRENTYVVFCSDHGEMLGDHGLYAKGVPYEPAIRVPLIVAGPEIPAGATSDSLVQLTDLHPTICELAGIKVSEHVDARSLVGELTGDPAQRRSFVRIHGRAYRALRTDRYKYVESYNDLPELYDLAEDPDETNNTADANPGLVNELGNRLRDSRD